MDTSNAYEVDDSTIGKHYTVAVMKVIDIAAACRRPPKTASRPMTDRRWVYEVDWPMLIESPMLFIVVAIVVLYFCGSFVKERGDDGASVVRAACVRAWWRRRRRQRAPRDH